MRAHELSKMLTSRSFISPTRQYLRIANTSRSWVPVAALIAQVREVLIACPASEDYAYESSWSKTQVRSYSIPYKDKIAKFKGKKGSDVCGTLLLEDPI